jgi:hypothetical protein
MTTKVPMLAKVNSRKPITFLLCDINWVGQFQRAVVSPSHESFFLHRPSAPPLFSVLEFPIIATKLHPVFSLSIITRFYFACYTRIACIIDIPDETP